MLNGKTAIILSPADDVHALTVAWEVERMGATALILDTTGFPANWKIEMSSRAGGGTRFVLTTPDGRRICDDLVSGVWWRRPRPFGIPVEVTETNHRDFCAAESRMLLEGWGFSLGRRLVNPLAAELAARAKPYQLMMAERAGLKIPKTLITNDPDAARHFVEGGGSHIYKAMTATRWQATETRQFQEGDVENLCLLAAAPAIFQQRIDGQPDVRVTVVDNQIFAAEIRTNHPGAKLDWRLDQAAEVRPHCLASDMEKALLNYQNTLGLRYGAYDLRLDDNGNYYFFEVNPSGQYLFVEIQAELPISRAIAEALLNDQN